jgi:hypothetical protein
MLISTKEYVKIAKSQIKQFKKDGRKGPQQIHFGRILPSFKQLIEILGELSKKNSCSIQMFRERAGVEDYTPRIYVFLGGRAAPGDLIQ